MKVTLGERVMTDRRYAWHNLKRYGGDIELEIDGARFGDFQTQIDDIRSEFGADYEDFCIDRQDDDYGGGDIHVTFVVQGFRGETDDEIVRRQDLEYNRAKAQTDRDRAAYEMLKVKLGEK